MKTDIADVLVRGLMDAHAKPAKRGSIGIGKGKAEEVIRSMFAEETGSHPLDSGSDGGRHWEQNKAHPKDGKPYIVFKGDEFEAIEVNTMKHLLKLVERGDMARDDECRRIERAMYVSEAKRQGERLNEVRVHCGYAEAYLEEKGYGGVGSFNTYNGTEFNDQTLQGVAFDHDGDRFVALQVHQGADVRGGYTQPRIFKVDGSVGVSEADAFCVEGECSQHSDTFTTYSRSELEPEMKVLADGEDRDGWSGLWPHCNKCGSPMEVQL